MPQIGQQGDCKEDLRLPDNGKINKDKIKQHYSPHPILNVSHITNVLVHEGQTYAEALSLSLEILSAGLGLECMYNVGGGKEGITKTKAN